MQLGCTAARRDEPARGEAARVQRVVMQHGCTAARRDDAACSDAAWVQRVVLQHVGMWQHGCTTARTDAACNKAVLELISAWMLVRGCTFKSRPARFRAVFGTIFAYFLILFASVLLLRLRSDFFYEIERNILYNNWPLLCQFISYYAVEYFD